MPRLRFTPAAIALAAVTGAALLTGAGALPAVAQTACGSETVAQDGEDFLRISRRCGASMRDLLVLNPGVDPRAPRAGTRVVVARAPTRQPPNLAAAYAEQVVGRWGPTAGECSDTGWDFAAGSIRGDRETFDILGFDGSPDDLRIVAQPRGSGSPVVLRLQPRGDRLTVTGGGTLGSLTRC